MQVLFPDNLLAIEVKRTKILINEPFYLGLQNNVTWRHVTLWSK